VSRDLFVVVWRGAERADGEAPKLRMIESLDHLANALGISQELAERASARWPMVGPADSRLYVTDQVMALMGVQIRHHWKEGS
jgi:hypothetical protein